MPQPTVQNELFTRLTACAKTPAQWANTAGTPLLGEHCWEIQEAQTASGLPYSFRLKIGDGTTSYADLPYYGDFVTLHTANNAALSVAVWDGTNGRLNFYKVTETNGIVALEQNPYLGLKAGSKVTISTQTVGGVNVLSINHAEQSAQEITETTATLTDGGTFTVATATDNYGHVTEWTEFTLPSIATAITNAIAALDSSQSTSGNVYVLTGITEVDGKLTAKTETQIVGGTNMSVVGASDSITINHDPINTSATDAASGITTDESSTIGEKEKGIVTGIKVDAQGHVIHIDKDVSTNLIAADIKAPVRVSDNTMWNFRETGGVISIQEDIAKIPVLKGNTIVWNQLVGASTSSITLVSQHKYYTVVGGTKSIQAGAGSAISVTGGTDMVVDLTKMFGSGSEPATPEEFEKLFPNSYYPYCEGRLVNLGGYGVKMNQLVQNGDFSDGTTNWNFSGSPTSSVLNNVLSVTFTSDTAFAVQNITLYVNHRYYLSAKIKGVANRVTYLQIGENVSTITLTTEFKRYSIIGTIGTGHTTNYNFIAIGSRNGAANEVMQIKDVDVIDLTAMFGPGSEPTLEEFEAMFPNDYYEYNAGTEMNIFDAIGDKKLELVSTGLNQYNNGQASVLKGKEYYVGGTYTSLAYSDNTAITVTNNKFIADRDDIITVTGGSADTIINITCDKDGTYEPYKKDTLDLDWIREIEYTPEGSETSEKLFPYGLLSAGSVYDEVTETKAIKRVDIRDYQSGDESDSTVITDGNKTHYALSVPKEILLAETHRMSYVVDDHGTEQQLPVSAYSPFNAPFVGEFLYMSNFKDAVLDLINRVNDYHNPVRGQNDTDQEAGKLAIYDSKDTTKSSNYAPSNATIVPSDSDNAFRLPTVEAIITYVQQIATTPLDYQGTVASYAALPSSGTKAGDVWILSANDAQAGYQAGDWFIRNKANTGWDVIQGTISVTNSNPTIVFNGSTYTIGYVEGTALQLTTPNLQMSDPSASGEATDLAIITNVSQTNGQVAATKKYIPSAGTSQKGVVKLVDDIHNSTAQDKVPTAKQAWDEFAKRNVKAVVVGTAVPTPNIYGPYYDPINRCIVVRLQSGITYDEDNRCIVYPSVM